MTPIEFTEQNKVLTKPAGMTDEQCQSLHVFCDGEQVISRWQMNWRERIRCLCTGKVWLSVWSGNTAPPVLLTVGTPFQHKDWTEDENAA